MNDAPILLIRLEGFTGKSTACTLTLNTVFFPNYAAQHRRHGFAGELIIQHHFRCPSVASSSVYWCQTLRKGSLAALRIDSVISRTMVEKNCSLTTNVQAIICRDSPAFCTRLGVDRGGSPVIWSTEGNSMQRWKEQVRQPGMLDVC